MTRRDRARRHAHAVAHARREDDRLHGVEVAFTDDGRLGSERLAGANDRRNAARDFRREQRRDARMLAGDARRAAA
jgi:hypothetical protein